MSDTTQATFATTIAVMGDAIYPMRYLALTALVLTFVDLRFGIKAARHRGETIRPSRAVRRTVDKLVNYICWMLLAITFGKAFGEPFGIPLLPYIITVVIFGCELNSCFSNYFEYNGKRLRFDIFKIFAKKGVIAPDEKEEGER